MLTLILTSSSLLLLPLVMSSLKHVWICTSLLLVILRFINLPLIYSPLLTPHSWSPLLFTDGLSAPLILLTLWITALMVIASQSILTLKNKPNKFLVLVLALNVILILTFRINNFITFYILFEASLIPTLLIILGWGYQPERLQAGIYLMIYTITASLPLLTGLILSYSSSFHLSINLINLHPIAPLSLTPIWWIIIIMAFIVKIPLFSVHLWLPKAHVEAPVAGSIVLAAILLKLGSYGLLRLAAIFTWVNSTLTPTFSTVAIWGACITGLICTRQTDMKSLIAYSSVGHMGLLVAGTMSNSRWGWSSSLVIMLAHGLCSSALFSLANITYELTSTRSTYISKGILSLFPITTILWFLISAINMAAPPSINLLGEIILITSASFISLILIPSILLTRFIAAAYSLILYTSSQHGWPPLFTALGHLFNPRNNFTTLIHFIPLISLIAVPEILSIWLWFLSITYICLPSKKSK